MNELLNNINNHKDYNNISACYHLFNFIISYKVNSLDELKKLEDRYFMTNDIKIRNEMKYNSYIADITHHEKLDANDKDKVVKLEKLYENETDEFIKTKYLILIYEIVNWELYFPYTAYKLIIEDKLNF